MKTDIDVQFMKSEIDVELTEICPVFPSHTDKKNRIVFIQEILNIASTLKQKNNLTVGIILK